jgi:Domain of unknown function (DUF5666)
MKTTLLLTLTLLAATATFAAQPVTPAPDTTIRGIITVVKGNAITLAKGLTIDVSGAEITRQGVAVNRSDLDVGNRVRAVVTATKNSGALVASKVLIEGADLTIIGTIEAATPASVTVIGQSLSLDKQTVYGGFAAGTTVAAAKDLKGGMPVAIDATSAPNGLSATRIVAIGPPPPAPPLPEPAQKTVTGAVTAIGKEQWTVGTTTIYISPKTQISGAPAVGDTASVTGIGTTEGAVIASTIRKQ